jgi:hypothetical protein
MIIWNQDKVAHGDHVCADFETPAQQRRILTDFVRAGLAAGDRVCCYTDAMPPDTVLDLLGDAGIPAGRTVAEGALVVRSTEETYLADLPFDPARMVAAMEDAVAQALADGYAGLRVSGDMGWATRQVAGADRLLEYESRVGAVFADQPAAALCQYDRRLFDTGTTNSTTGLHTQRLVTTLDRPRTAAITPLADTQGLRLAGEFDMTARTSLQAALSGLTDVPEVHLELAELQFVDAGCVTELMRLARPPRRLTLHDPPPLLLRLVDLLAPNGDVEVRHS